MPTVNDLVQHALHSMRTHLRLEVSFVSEFKNGRRYFRYVDGDKNFIPIAVGDSGPLEESIVSGLSTAGSLS